MFNVCANIAEQVAINHALRQHLPDGDNTIDSGLAAIVKTSIPDAVIETGNQCPPDIVTANLPFRIIVAPIPLKIRKHQTERKVTPDVQAQRREANLFYVQFLRQ